MCSRPPYLTYAYYLTSRPSAAQCQDYPTAGTKRRKDPGSSPGIRGREEDPGSSPGIRGREEDPGSGPGMRVGSSGRARSATHHPSRDPRTASRMSVVLTALSIPGTSKRSEERRVGHAW